VLALRYISFLHNKREIILGDICCVTPAYYGGRYIGDRDTLYTVHLQGTLMSPTCWRTLF